MTKVYARWLTPGWKKELTRKVHNTKQGSTTFHDFSMSICCDNLLLKNMKISHCNCAHRSRQISFTISSLHTIGTKKNMTLMMMRTTWVRMLIQQLSLRQLHAKRRHDWKHLFNFSSSWMTRYTRNQCHIKKEPKTLFINWSIQVMPQDWWTPPAEHQQTASRDSSVHRAWVPPTNLPWLLAWLRTLRVDHQNLLNENTNIWLHTVVVRSATISM